MAERQQALARVDPGGSRGREPVVVHRRRRHQRDAEQRPHADQPEAASTSATRRATEVIRRLQRERRQGAGHHALHAAGAGPDHRGSRQPHAVPVHARGRRTPSGSREWVPQLVERLQQAAAARRRRQRPAGPGPAGLRRHRPRHRQPPRRHAGGHRRRALQRLRPAPDLDHLHAGEPVPRGARGRRRDFQLGPRGARTRSTSRADGPGGAARCRSTTRSRAITRASARRSRSTTSASSRRRRCRSTSRRARRSARPSTAIEAAQRELRHAGQRADALPGRGGGVPRLARQHAAADPRGDRHDVHRARRALRELHPPDHDPLDAAVGRRRRAARAAAHRHRPRADRRSSASSC